MKAPRRLGLKFLSMGLDRSHFQATLVDLMMITGQMTVYEYLVHTFSGMDVSFIVANVEFLLVSLWDEVEHEYLEENSISSLRIYWSCCGLVDSSGLGQPQ